METGKKNNSGEERRGEMGKTRVEVCLISGRGLQASSTALFWKTQWFAVGWIDPKDKYCTKMEAPSNGNPVWGTKFSTSLDNSPAATLQVEVYSRDPLLLREKLHGTATVLLREFLANPKGNEERGSYQLRKKNSDKARGFVDVSIRVLGRGGGDGQQHHPFSTYSSSFPAAGGGDGVVMLVDDEREVALTSNSRDDYVGKQYKIKGGPSPLPLAAHRDRGVGDNYYWGAQPYTQPTPFPSNLFNNSVGGPTYPPAAAAISNYLNLPSRPVMPTPSLLPSPHNYHLPLSDYTGRRTSYINMPSSSSSSTGGGGGGFGIGAGIGAVGAGAFLFGDEFVSGALDLL